ncbi:MAG: hypothetical protein AAB774_03030 [Patescibacteria group bacterium]
MKNALLTIAVCAIASAVAFGQNSARPGSIWPSLEKGWQRSYLSPEAPWQTRTLDFHKNGKALTMIVEIPPNDRIRLFHINREICNTSITEVGRDLKADVLGDKISPVCRKIAKQLYAVRGIAKLMFRPYDVHVEIGDAFTWKEVEPKVIATLRDVGLGLKQHIAVVALRNEAKQIPVTIKKSENACFRSFSTRRLISHYEISSWSHPFTTYGDERSDDLSRLGPIGTELARKVTAIEGVSEIFITPYKVDVLIGDAYSWAAIQPQVVAVIQNEIAKHDPSIILR